MGPSRRERYRQRCRLSCGPWRDRAQRSRSSAIILSSIRQSTSGRLLGHGFQRTAATQGRPTHDDVEQALTRRAAPRDFLQLAQVNKAARELARQPARGIRIMLHRLQKAQSAVRLRTPKRLMSQGATSGDSSSAPAGRRCRRPLKLASRSRAGSGDVQRAGDMRARAPRRRHGCTLQGDRYTGGHGHRAVVSAGGMMAESVQCHELRKIGLTIS